MRDQQGVARAGLTIVIRSAAEAERMAVAQVTIESIKQHLGIQN